jgi:hypothetical protein
MESAAAPNSGVRSRSCGVIEGTSSAEDAGRSVVVSDVTCSALLTSPGGSNFVRPQSSVNLNIFVFLQ